jgi:hypothetical protein
LLVGKNEGKTENVKEAFEKNVVVKCINEGVKSSDERTRESDE